MSYLTVTNNGDGTWQAVVNDPSPGATYLIRRAPYTGAVGTGRITWDYFDTVNAMTAYTLAGPAIAAGYYLWMADSTEAGVGCSDAVLKAITTTSQSLHERIQVAALALAQTLDLPGVVSVRRAKLPIVELDGGAMPAVLHVTFQSSEQEDGELGSNVQDGWAFPIYVVFARQGLYDDETDAADTLLRERYRKAFHNQPLSGVAEVALCRVEPGPIIDMKQPDADLQLGSMVLRFRCKEWRGLVL